MSCLVPRIQATDFCLSLMELAQSDSAFMSAIISSGGGTAPSRPRDGSASTP